jgi:hypothetical protein
MIKSERVQLILTEEEMQRLEELAAVNAGENKSKMIRDLINLAWQNPAGLNLFDPKRVALAA